MTKDSKLTKKTRVLLEFGKKLEKLYSEGKISEDTYNKKKQDTTEKLLSLKNESLENINLKIDGVITGFSELDRLLVGGIISREKYNLLSEKFEKRKNDFYAEKVFVEGCSKEEYLDYLAKKIDMEDIQPNFVREYSNLERPKVSVESYSWVLLCIFAIILGGLITFSTFKSIFPLIGVNITKVEAKTKFIKPSDVNTLEMTTIAVTTTVPIGEPVNVVEIGREYDKVYNLIEINHKLAFIAEKDGESAVVYDGQELGGLYDKVESLLVLNRSPLFIAKRDNGFFVVHGGVTIGDEYDDVGDMRLLKDSVVFVAEQDGKKFVVYNGSDIYGDNGYDAISDLLVVNETIAFIARKANRSFVVYDGNEMGGDYDAVVPGSLRAINNRLVFTAKSGGKYFIIHGGKEFGREYQSAINPTDIGGKLAYLAKDGGKEFVIYDGSLLGGKYNEVLDDSIREINGRVAFIAVEYPFLPLFVTTKKIVIYDGKRVGGKYDSVRSDSLIEINDKIAFIATKTMRSGAQVIVYGGKEMTTRYDNIYSLKVLRGSLAFVAKKGSEYVLVNNGVELGAGRGYEKISDVCEVNNKITFTAEKNGKSFIVMEE